MTEIHPVFESGVRKNMTHAHRFIALVR